MRGGDLRKKGKMDKIATYRGTIVPKTQGRISPEDKQTETLPLWLQDSGDELGLEGLPAGKTRKSILNKRFWLLKINWAEEKTHAGNPYNTANVNLTILFI